MKGLKPCPCPLCGNPDLSVRYEPFITGLSYGIVECEPCALSLREDDIEQAVGRWNSRAETTTDVDALVGHYRIIPVKGHDTKQAVFDVVMGDAIAVCPDEIAAGKVLAALSAIDARRGGGDNGN